MLNFQKVVNEQLKILRPDPAAIKSLQKISKDFIDKLKQEILNFKINADVFVGGSFAKGTLLRSDNYDVDIFVRFDSKYKDISDLLEKFLNRLRESFKARVERVHGSRDYFIVRLENTSGYFEVIPVIKIRKPTEEKNVTDLTYFHGSYVK